jgi:hypothetical protein
MSRVYTEKTGIATWTYYFVGLMFLPILTIFLSGLYRQFIMGKQFGNNPTSDKALIGITIGVLIFCFLILWLMIVMKSEIKVADKTIYYRFPPFINRERAYRLNDIVKCEVVKRSFITTGIGLRYDPTRKATIYSTGTSHFLSLELDTGKRILLSTKHPQDLQQILESAEQ